MVKLSKKGAITIPSVFRNDLGWEAGDDLSVTRIGDIIIIQKLLKINESLEFLRKNKDKILSKEVSPKEIKDLVWGLIGQQLVSAEDKVINRTENKAVILPGISKIFNETVEQIVSTWQLWKQGKFNTFFYELSSMFEISYPSLITHSVTRLKVLLETEKRNGDVDPVVLFSVPIGRALEMFQRKTADLVTADLKASLELQDKIEISQTDLESILYGINAFESTLLLSLQFARQIAKVERNAFGLIEYQKEKKKVLEAVKMVVMEPKEKRKAIKSAKERLVPPEPPNLPSKSNDGNS